MRDLTAQQAADQMQLTAATITGYARAGMLPGAYQVGRRWRIPVDALDALKADTTSILPPRNNRSRAQMRRAA